VNIHARETPPLSGPRCPDRVQPGAVPSQILARPLAHIRALPVLLLLAALSALPACGAGDEALAAARSGPSSGTQRPSVILVSIDTLRQDHVGFHGYERDTTPQLDRLAARSLVFERAYSVMSWTLVAHMSMLTGLHPAQHGVVSQDQALSAAVPTLAERLQAEGYATLGFYDSKWLDPRYGSHRGFDVYRRHRGAEQAGAHLFEALAASPRERPIFAFLHLMDVHNQPLTDSSSTMYAPPEPFASQFLQGARERIQGLDMEAAWETGGLVDADQHEALVALYDGGIRSVDDLLGRWITAWERAGLLDNTLLIVTSDHGEGLDQRGTGYGGHGHIYEEGLRVPLIIHLPGDARAGERIDTPVSLIDVLPTVLSFAGLEQDSWLPGQALLATPLEDVLIYAEQPERVESVLRWPWKLMSRKDGQGTRLYNLLEDPLELAPLDSEVTPLRGLPLRVFQGLSRRIADEQARWHRPSLPNPQATPLSADESAALRALGYLGTHHGGSGE
jgi:arylsulfatase A-like enzyme